MKFRSLFSPRYLLLWAVVLGLGTFPLVAETITVSNLSRSQVGDGGPLRSSQSGEALNQILANSFTTGDQPGNLLHVRFRSAYGESATGLGVSIFTDVGGKPGALVESLASGALQGDGYHVFASDGNLPLSANTTYWWVASLTADGQFRVPMGNVTTEPVAGGWVLGRMSQSQDGGATWSSQSTTVSLFSMSVSLPDPVEGTISYQGRLVDGGQMASGSYDFQFLLMDAATGGQSLGPTLSRSLTVRQGVFTTPLAFAPEHFTGAPRWIEVRVRPTPATGATGAEYAVLERQRVQFAPYAFRAVAASTVTSVPVQSLPASVPLKNSEGKLDSAMIASDIARAADVSALSQTVQQAQALIQSQAAALAQLQTQVATLTQENTTLRQSIEAAGAPARSGWMVASWDASDASLISSGFTRAFSTPASAWVSGSTASAPSARVESASVWTGQEWWVWGGRTGTTPLATGAGYRPSTDSWLEIAASDAPEARSGHSAVWTGSEMIVWGGFGKTSLNTGGRFSRGGISWTPTTTLNAPVARQGHGAVWTGRVMLVFGGRNTSGLLNDGGIYDPVQDQWTALPTSQAPSPRSGATVIWTGSGLLVWGGETSGGGDATGGYLRFDENGNPLGWEALPLLSGFAARSGHVAAWTGQRLIVWGGRGMSRELLGDGAVLDLASGTWSRMSGTDAPTARSQASGVWTGEELLVLGGQDAGGVGGAGRVDGGGGAWRMSSGTWRALPAGVPRAGAAAAWTGSEFLWFGGTGTGGVTPLGQLQRIAAVAPWHFYRRAPN